MDLKSGSTIIGRPQMLFKIAGKESVSLLQKGGSRIIQFETLRKYMDGLLNTACSTTTSRRSRSTERLLEDNEIDTTIKLIHEVFSRNSKITCNDGSPTRTRKLQNSSRSKIPTKTH